MQLLYFASVWLHILAATAWVGGMMFLVLVVVPWLRAGNRKNAGTFLRDTGLRFRNVGWICFGIVLLTGSFNLWVRGVRFASFVDRDWLASPFGHMVMLKLGLFAVVLTISGVHDFAVGPQASRAIQEGPGRPEAEALRRRASLLGRANALLALLLVAIGVAIVRGVPW